MRHKFLRIIGNTIIDKCDLTGKSCNLHVMFFYIIQYFLFSCLQMLKQSFSVHIIMPLSLSAAYDISHKMQSHRLPQTSTNQLLSPIPSETMLSGTSWMSDKLRGYEPVKLTGYCAKMTTRTFHRHRNNR